MKAHGEENLLEIRELRTCFQHDGTVARAVDGVSLSIRAGRTLGLVGESGSGKSVTALSILRLIPVPGRIEGGSILFRGRDLLALPEEELRRIRGNEIAMIFQEPMSALNPVFTVGEQIAESVRLHRGLERAAARARAIEMLERVGIPDPAARVDEYPHRLSGGMRQRVLIAMAMACDPALLVADEPTTALDVTVQAQILHLIRELRERSGMGVLLITHDLGVIAENAQEVAVMYAGRIVESAAVEELFARPRHPYTIGLLRSLPELARPGERLAAIPGTVPSASAPPSGCRFHTRCPIARESCAREEPALVPLEEGSAHRVACPFVEEALKP
jgi:oligopeptide/dipeptide ABC transporter ATP-binding protein